jgi:hypothetical protein
MSEDTNLIIGVCGFIGTGSSAVSDFLKEFDENVVFDKFEFDFIKAIDSIADMSWHISQGNTTRSTIAIHRFKKRCDMYYGKMRSVAGNQFKLLTDSYIDNIIMASWYGNNPTIDKYFHPYLTKFRISRKMIQILKVLYAKYQKKTGKYVNRFPFHKFNITDHDNFYDITRKYIEDILKMLGKEEGKNMVLDQLFSVNNPQSTMKFFNNPRAVIVDRDPRDQYLYFKNYLYPKHRRLIPADNVENFVTAYKNMRKGMPYTIPDANILIVKFEDMVYEYSETTRRVADFLELKNHNRPKTIFNPEISVGNTQLFRNFPQYEQDILYIEKELPEYLYPFEKKKGVNFAQGKTFGGRAQKMTLFN